MKQSIKAVDIISPEEPPNLPSFPSLPDLEVHGLDTGGEAVSGGSMGSEPAGVGLGVEPGVGGVGLPFAQVFSPLLLLVHGLSKHQHQSFV